jgi:protein-disulfide isomerase
MKPINTEKTTSFIIIGLLCSQVIFQGILFLRLTEIDRNVKTFNLILQSNYALSSTIFNIPVEPDRPIKGSIQAQVTIIEFSDFECPICKEMEPVLENVIKKYPGKVNVTYRYFPLHPESFSSALSAECAHRQAAFWKMHDFLFSHQNDISQDMVLSYAAQLGLNQTAFKACLSSPETMTQIQTDISSGQKYGVTGTPTFFINGRMISGSIPEIIFENLIDETLHQ